MIQLRGSAAAIYETLSGMQEDELQDLKLSDLAARSGVSLRTARIYIKTLKALDLIVLTRPQGNSAYTFSIKTRSANVRVPQLPGVGSYYRSA